MKLLLCEHCWDVFKLKQGELRQCECGRVKGRYIDNRMAEVTPNAIGNGDLDRSIGDMRQHQADTNDKAPREDYYKVGNGRLLYAWVRPNTGPGNPHTRLMEQD